MTSSNSKEFVIDNSQKSYMEVMYNATADLMTTWLGSSPMPVWVRVWLCFLMVGAMSPFAFLPHPFAIANAVGFGVVLGLNGREVVRVRGVNKNMGWPHVVAWIPVLVVDILSVTTDLIDGQQLTWDNAGSNNYYKARVFFVWYNFVVFAISCLLDTVDTIMYYFNDVKNVDRSDWTIAQLEKENQSDDKNSDTEKV
ncbi:MAG: hypothetical protein SGILL_008305 [Bacillariaceae sp.]